MVHAFAVDSEIMWLVEHVCCPTCFITACRFVCPFTHLTGIEFITSQVHKFTSSQIEHTKYMGDITFCSALIGVCQCISDGQVELMHITEKMEDVMGKTSNANDMSWIRSLEAKVYKVESELWDCVNTPATVALSFEEFVNWMDTRESLPKKRKREVICDTKDILYTSILVGVAMDCCRRWLEDDIAELQNDIKENDSASESCCKIVAERKKLQILMALDESEFNFHKLLFAIIDKQHDDIKDILESGQLKLKIK